MNEMSHCLYLFLFPDLITDLSASAQQADELPCNGSTALQHPLL